MKENNVTSTQDLAEHHRRELQQAELKKVSGGATPPQPDAKRRGDTDPPQPDAAPNW